MQLVIKASSIKSLSWINNVSLTHQNLEA